MLSSYLGEEETDVAEGGEVGSDLGADVEDPVGGVDLCGEKGKGEVWGDGGRWGRGRGGGSRKSRIYTQIADLGE